MAKEKKGTVKLLSSEFPPAEIQKASELAKGAILERHKLLDQLKDFVSDNANLINQIQNLPSELHHDVMVPFGKAAFFPGRLIHTNELMVLLGEGYYVERTSKQTVDILKRRGKTLESHIESIKAEIQDLKAETSVFEATAEEAAAGVVQIMEEYDDESSSLEAFEEGGSNPAFPGSVKTEKSATTLKDEEYKRVLDRIAELEKEEEEAEMDNSDDEDDLNEDDLARNKMREAEMDNSDDEDDLNEDDLARNKMQFSLNQLVESSGVEHSNPQPVHEGVLVPKSVVKSSSSKKSPLVPKSVRFADEVKSGSSKKSPELPGIKEKAPRMIEDEEILVPRPEPVGSCGSKAFTGSIVEHNTNNLDPRGQTVAQNSKPVSKFRMRNK